MTALGHENAFPPLKLSDCYRFGKQTAAGANGNENDAPTTAIRETAIEPPGSPPERSFVGRGAILERRHETWRAAARSRLDQIFRLRFRGTRATTSGASDEIRDR